MNIDNDDSDHRYHGHDDDEEREKDLVCGARVELDAFVICSAVPDQTIIPDQNSLINDSFLLWND